MSTDPKEFLKRRLNQPKITWEQAKEQCAIQLGKQKPSEPRPKKFTKTYLPEDV